MKGKKELQKSNHLLLDTYCHLYLVTLPLPADMAECELEDLFPQDVLHTKIRGRSFSRKDEDPHLYYNKDIFSKYIYANRGEVDFSGFRPLLNIIRDLCL